MEFGLGQRIAITNFDVLPTAVCDVLRCPPDVTWNVHKWTTMWSRDLVLEILIQHPIWSVIVETSMDVNLHSKSLLYTSGYRAPLILPHCHSCRNNHAGRKRGRIFLGISGSDWDLSTSFTIIYSYSMVVKNWENCLYSRSAFNPRPIGFKSMSFAVSMPWNLKALSLSQTWIRY